MAITSCCLFQLSPHMTVSLILCTYNRCGSLAETLESVANSEMPDSVEWEILVVDNNSTDRTRETVDECSRRHPGRIRYLFEPQQGKSLALNAGIRWAWGDILAFTDDDVTVERTWLRNLTSCLEGGEWSGSGGRTLLARAYAPPAWLALEGSDTLGGALAALFDLGDEPRKLEQAPFGANMAFRKSVFQKYGDFRTDLGPQPGSKIRNEDTEFGNRLLASGERLRYEPSAIVYHPIPEDRIQKEYFLDWYFDYGRADIREIGRRPDIMGVPRRYLTIPKIIGTVMFKRTLRWLTTFNPQRRFFHKCWVWVAAGQVKEIYLQWRDVQSEGAGQS